MAVNIERCTCSHDLSLHFAGKTCLICENCDSYQSREPVVVRLTEPRFPEIEVQLTGQDGNGFFIASRVARAIEDAGHPDEAIDFFEEALSSNYDRLLMTCMKWVTVL